MSKTVTLRRLIRTQLQTVAGETYHKSAPPNAAYPNKVYTLKSVSFTDARDDFDLCIDIWHRGDVKVAEELADQIERLLNNANLPQETIFPTFFRESRYTVEDPDKELIHLQLRFIVQLYEEE